MSGTGDHPIPSQDRHTKVFGRRDQYPIMQLRHIVNRHSGQDHGRIKRYNRVVVAAIDVQDQFGKRHIYPFCFGQIEHFHQGDRRQVDTVLAVIGSVENIGSLATKCGVTPQMTYDGYCVGKIFHPRYL